MRGSGVVLDRRRQFAHGGLERLCVVPWIARHLGQLLRRGLECRELLRLLDHFLRHLEIGDDAIAQRADRLATMIATNGYRMATGFLGTKSTE